MNYWEKSRLASVIAFCAFSGPADGGRYVPSATLVCLDQQTQQSDAQFENSIGMKFVTIAPGSFLMGSPESESGRFSQETQHEVEITYHYYLGITEVTVGQFKQVTSRSFSTGEENWAETNLAWHDANDFCHQLSNLPEERAAQRSYRLPTEAEWEFACRSGSDKAFCYGSDEKDLATYAWMYDHPAKARGPVASLQPNAWGLYDMHGGVWEWCSDWFAEYPSTKTIDPAGPLRGESRVLRGGCHESPVPYCRSAMRMPFDPAKCGSNNVGFRVVLLQNSPEK